MTGARRGARNPLALAVLAYLSERPMHPYELGKLLRERNQHVSIHYRQSSLYMAVEQLRRAGHVVEQETVRDGRRPDRTVYRLTGSGRGTLLAWMREWVAVPVEQPRQFEAALALIATLPPAEVVDLLASRRRALGERADRIRATVRTALADGVDPLFLVEDSYRLALVEAEQAFVERFGRQIVDGAPDFGRYWRDLHATGPTDATGDR